MMRVALVVLVVVAMAVGVGFMRERLETRPEKMPPGSTLVIDATARVRGPKEHAPSLARGLLSACLVEAAAGSEVSSFHWGKRERFRFVVRPALDQPDRRQLHGCLEDLRVPHLIVAVNRMETVPPPA